MKLTDADKKHWAPNPEIVNQLAERAKGKSVLEIGPGHVPFPVATEFVDWDVKRDLPGKVHKVDLNSEPLPFKDKAFDFIYCRHVLEDMFNPFPLIKEMSRVGKSGYIETPSPFAEMGRGVDGGSPEFRGYHHHRWVIWKEADTLHFVTKYPMVEYLWCGVVKPSSGTCRTQSTTTCRRNM
jgi:SAM-dependent methyltransferase